MDERIQDPITIELRLDPRVLSDPDADLRYLIPEVIEERSGGTIRSDGYDYEGDVPILVMFLVVNDVSGAMRMIRDVLDSAVLLGNELRGKYTVGVASEPSG